MRRTPALLTLSLLALAATASGCGSSGGSVETGDGGITTSGVPTTPTVASTPTTMPPRQTDLPADQIVWQVSAGGGFVPMSSAAADVPALTIYGDGRILATSDDTTRRYDATQELVLRRVSPADLQVFLDAADTSGLFTTGTDFGTPGVTDLPTTTVTLHGTGPSRKVGVYALGFGEEPGGPGGLSAQQVSNRAALSDLIGTANELGGKGDPWVPDRVRATTWPGSTMDDGSAPAERWPGPAFANFPASTEGGGGSCLVIEGDDAAAVYRAARSNAGTRWTDGTDERTIVVAPLVPGADGCPTD